MVSQPPKSPDFNMLDAFRFPSLERECQRRGAMTHNDIRVAVGAVWRNVTPAEFERAVERVVVNMKRSVELGGGSFYHEGRSS